MKTCRRVGGRQCGVAAGPGQGERVLPCYWCVDEVPQQFSGLYSFPINQRETEFFWVKNFIASSLHSPHAPRESSHMHAFQVETITPRGHLGPSKAVHVDAERMCGNEVVASAGEIHKIPRPKFTYSLGLCIPQTGHDVAIVGECGARGRQVPQQIWIFSEFAHEVVTQEGDCAGSNSDTEDMREIPLLFTLNKKK